MSTSFRTSSSELRSEKGSWPNRTSLPKDDRAISDKCQWLVLGFQWRNPLLQILPQCPVHQFLLSMHAKMPTYPCYSTYRHSVALVGPAPQDNQGSSEASIMQQICCGVPTGSEWVVSMLCHVILRSLLQLVCRYGAEYSVQKTLSILPLVSKKLRGLKEEEG